MKKLLVVTPVKDSIDTTELTVRSVMKSDLSCEWEYVVYDDFSKPENSERLDALAKELGFSVVHLSDITNTPSPNYRLVLQIIQEKALSDNMHIVLVESDVLVKVDTLKRLFEKVDNENIGMVASVTVDETGNVNFPYLYAAKWDTSIDKVTNKRFSFCCTLLTNSLLGKYDFHDLNPEKSWYDVFISHKSVELGMTNILMMTNPVVHKPHASRPWKLLKYTNPIKYYWLKFTKGLDKI